MLNLVVGYIHTKKQKKNKKQKKPDASFPVILMIKELII